MTIAEHLIENAIGYLESEQDFENFTNSPMNRAMAESIDINLLHVWEMAQHVYCCIKPLWEDDLMKKEVITNGDKIRQMSNEELAEFINNSSPCANCINADYVTCNAMCITSIKAYLESEVAE